MATDIVKAFDTPRERKLTKMLRRKLRMCLENVKGGEDRNMETEYTTKLREVRERIGRSRPVKVSSVLELKETLKHKCLWRQEHSRRIQCDIYTYTGEHRDVLRGFGCRPYRPGPQFVFHPLSVGYSSAQLSVYLCEDCFNNIHCCADLYWTAFMRGLTVGKKHLGEFLPVYVDYKRTVNASVFYPNIVRESSMLIADLASIEELSEDEDDGETSYEFEGRVNYYVELSTGFDFNIPSGQSKFRNISSDSESDSDSVSLLT